MNETFTTNQETDQQTTAGSNVNVNTKSHLEELQENKKQLEKVSLIISERILQKKSSLREANEKQEQLNNEKPVSFFFFGGTRKQDEIDKEKQENQQALNNLQSGITELEQQKREIDNEISRTVEKINAEYIRQVNEDANKLKELSSKLDEQLKNNEEDKKQQQESIKQLEEQNKEMKEKIEEQKKIIEEKDAKTLQNNKNSASDKYDGADEGDFEGEEEEEEQLDDEELTILAKETIRYLNSIPEYVERKGMLDDGDLEDIKQWLVSNDITSVQDLKDGVDSFLKEILTLYGGQEDYEEKNTSELLASLEEKNKKLIEMVEKNDQDAIDRYQKIVNEVQNDVNKTNLFIKILMWFGYDYKKLNTKLAVAKQQLKQKQTQAIINSKKISSKLDKHNEFKEEIIENQISNNEKEIESHKKIYNEYSMMNLLNTSPDQSLEAEKKRQEGFSL